jgi:hypothetical protein
MIVQLQGGQSVSVPTIEDDAADRWWARRKRAFAHPTAPQFNFPFTKWKRPADRFAP